MSQISISEASDLLKKLFDERIPVTAFLIGPSRVRFLLKGFVVGATKEQGLFVGDRLPPEISVNWVNVSPFVEGRCMFEYGERREIPEGFRDDVFLADLGESLLTIRFLTTSEILSIFFTT